MIIYSNLTDTFSLLDYSQSHSQLLLRSRDNISKQNIDILFKSVASILITSKIIGVEISVVELSQTDAQFKNQNFVINKKYKLFSLKSFDGREHFINAGSFGVFNNNLDILETSIGRYDMGNMGENLLWYS